MPANYQLCKWALRSLLRSHRVRFATAVGFVFHLLSTFTLIKLIGKGNIPPFIYLAGFVPIVILATVTQGNLFGIDRGSALTAFVTPVRARTFCRVRLVVAMCWTLGTLLMGWILGMVVIGERFLPIILLQLGFCLLLGATGGMLSVFAPSSRSYARTTGQTMSVPTLVPLNAVSLLGIGGVIKFLRLGNDLREQTTLAAICALILSLLGVVAVVAIGVLAESRKERIMDALEENP